jgi:hypothetical protein
VLARRRVADQRGHGEGGSHESHVLLLLLLLLLLLFLLFLLLRLRLLLLLGGELAHDCGEGQMSLLRVVVVSELILTDGRRDRVRTAGSSRRGGGSGGDMMESRGGIYDRLGLVGMDAAMGGCWSVKDTESVAFEGGRLVMVL